MEMESIDKYEGDDATGDHGFKIIPYIYNQFCFWLVYYLSILQFLFNFVLLLKIIA